jgi:hypothetical protein
MQLPTLSLLMHPNKGGQYCGNAHRKLPHDHKTIGPRSHRGDYYGKAQTESLWSRLKSKVLEGREQPCFADLADAQASVANYFDYYRHERLHPSIDN